VPCGNRRTPVSESAGYCATSASWQQGYTGTRYYFTAARVFQDGGGSGVPVAAPQHPALADLAAGPGTQAALPGCIATICVCSSLQGDPPARLYRLVIRASLETCEANRDCWTACRLPPLKKDVLLSPCCLSPAMVVLPFGGQASSGAVPSCLPH
jgi:hypothetical protein